MRFLALLLFAFRSRCAPRRRSRPSVIGKAWMVGDLSSGQLLASQKADERFEPASLTKLMTAYVVFIALREKKLSLEQQVNVSPRAWSASGSRMFIEPRKPGDRRRADPRHGGAVGQRRLHRARRGGGAAARTRSCR